MAYLKGMDGLVSHGVLVLPPALLHHLRPLLECTAHPATSSHRCHLRWRPVGRWRCRHKPQGALHVHDCRPHHVHTSSVCMFWGLGCGTCCVPWGYQDQTNPATRVDPVHEGQARSDHQILCTLRFMAKNWSTWWNLDFHVWKARDSVPRCNVASDVGRQG
jgi:hypothetical protein